MFLARFPILMTETMGKPAMSANNYVRWFSDIRLCDVKLVGGKTASLGELYSNLQGVRFRTGLL